MEKKKRFSVLKLLIIILCIVAIILSAASNFLFAGGKTPHILGRYIYLVGDDNPMTGDITTGAALISMEADNISIATGDIILCYPADNPDKLTLRSVSFVAESDDGVTSYYTKDSYHDDEATISKASIVAVCTGYPESLELGRLINFAKSITGIVALLAVPLLLIVLFIITALASRQGEEEIDDEFGFYEYEEEPRRKERKSHARHSDPLYDPSPDTLPNPEFERKKMSIAENFKQKQVNPNSPYQKEREKERTMQFMAQKNGNLSNTMQYTASGTAESNFAARNPGNISSSAPTAETLREEMLRKTASSMTERTGTYNIRNRSEAISDNTGVLSTSQVAELRGGVAPTPTAVKTDEASIPAPRKSSSPDISDILGKTTSPRATKKPADMSVDDLLKMIENEKNRL